MRRSRRCGCRCRSAASRHPALCFTPASPPRAAAAAQQRVSSAGRQLAHLRHQLEHLDHMLGRQRPRAESCLAGRAKGCGVYRDGTSAWYPAGRVVYDAEDYSLYDDVVRTRRWGGTGRACITAALFRMRRAFTHMCRSGAGSW